MALAVLTGCQQQKAVAPFTDTVDATAYAELLQMQALDDGLTLCRIIDPWDTAAVVRQYLLVPRADTTWSQADTRLDAITADYGDCVVLRTPLRRNTLTNACHAWLLSQLDALENVAVMCDTAYLLADTLRQWVRGQVSNADGTPLPAPEDGGSAMSPNTEVMMAAHSDALWIAPYENADMGQLTSLPIPLIYCADNMERHPLGRAEWMRFYGRLVGRTAEADSLFRRIATTYESLTHSDTTNVALPRLSADTAASHARPTLLAELPYGATWYVPGGRSCSAALYADAGYRYLWDDDVHAGSLALSPEAVLARAQCCDVWVFKYYDPSGDWTLSSLLAQHPIYGQFRATGQGQVWGCNTAHSDFFDITPFRPDTLLRSLRDQNGHFFRRL